MGINRGMKKERDIGAEEDRKRERERREGVRADRRDLGGGGDERV